jgi:UDPglucose 6-dehydrogenase
MNVCVQGLWHLGCVTAACLAAGGHTVTGLDFDPEVVRNLQAGQPPLFEPGLEELVKSGLAAGRLSFTTDPAAALAGAGVLWVTYDTPVDDEDRADVDFVLDQLRRALPHAAAGSLVLISAQLPVGSTRQLENWFRTASPDTPLSFACSPENLRLGKAIQVFTNPDRVVAGVRSETDRQKITDLLKPFTERIEWMSVESAEMTKHAINAFLATSVTFINEIAAVCEQVGADAKEVERGLKSESRIGPRAYLGPGGPFAGGTLARDTVFLTQLGRRHELPLHLFNAVLASNNEHKHWPRRRLLDALGSLQGKIIAVWGLTYKPGTDTLRRSTAVELCRWLIQQQAAVRVYDPAVKALPVELQGRLVLSSAALEAAQGAEALVIATEWPEFNTIPAHDLLPRMQTPWVIDANRFLARSLGSDPRTRYLSVGKARA